MLPDAMHKEPTHVDLLRRPRIHGQRLDLGDVRAQFAVQRGAAHAQEDAHLSGKRSAGNISNASDR